MTALLSPIRGYTVRCSVDRCTSSTAEQAPSRFVRTAELAVRTAHALGWVDAALAAGEAHRWFCPLHQAWDEASRRWVPAPEGRG